MIKRAKLAGLVLLVASASLLSGCATGSKPEAMVPQQATLVHKINGDVSVAVSGGKETSPAWASQISDDAFAQAIGDAIQKYGLFSKVSSSGTQYKLTAFIGKVDQPMFGLSLTVKMEVSYTLTDLQSGKSVWVKNISSEYTAKTGEAFAAVKRLRLANEGAARNNIQQMISEVSSVTL